MTNALNEHETENLWSRRVIERPNRKWRKQARKVIRILRKMIRDAQDHQARWLQREILRKRDGGEQ